MTGRVLLAVFFWLVAGNFARAERVDTGHLIAELVAESQSVAPGETIQLALIQNIDKGWHTYWRNPGDSGEPTSIVWTLPKGWSTGEIVWAPPHRLPVGPLLNYGYEGEVVLPVSLTIPKDTQTGPATIVADVTFLVCAEICIPEQARLSLTLNVANAGREPGPFAQKIAAALSATPKPANLTGVWAYDGERIKFAVVGDGLNGAVTRAYFYPFSGVLIAHAAPQALDRGSNGITLSTKPGLAFRGGKKPADVQGVLEFGGKYAEVSFTEGALPAEARGLGAPPAEMGAQDGLGFPIAFLFAFLGGLILNLMPCVFPILAMKAASLADHAHDKREARRQALGFLGGVLATFLALAGILLVARAGGEAVGWGFQLQSPEIVAGLALLMMLIALNLAGVFDVAGRLQNAGTGLSMKKGITGSVLTGMLAVIVAAPCTAPFMAGALGYALTASIAVALGVFVGLGLGFALPFVAIAFVPGLLSRLPRPGLWMERLRILLSFPMFGAVAWLVWVLSVQTGSQALAAILAGLVALGFAAWSYGNYQRAGNRGWLVAATLALVMALGLAIAASRTGEGGNISVGAAEVPTEVFTPERLAALRGEGKAVFVNFTAAWCITCQVNERVALSTSAVAKAFSDNDVVYLKADWTRRDETIAKILSEHGRAGVPLYLVYDAKGGAPIILPQLLTESIVVKALENAAQPRSRTDQPFKKEDPQ